MIITLGDDNPHGMLQNHMQLYEIHVITCETYVTTRDISWERNRARPTTVTTSKLPVDQSLNSTLIFTYKDLRDGKGDSSHIEVTLFM